MMATFLFTKEYHTKNEYNCIFIPDFEPGLRIKVLFNFQTNLIQLEFFKECKNLQQYK